MDKAIHPLCKKCFQPSRCSGERKTEQNMFALLLFIKQLTEPEKIPELALAMYGEVTVLLEDILKTTDINPIAFAKEAKKRNIPLCHTGIRISTL